MQAVERVFLGNNWITLVLLFAFVLLFFMKVFKPNRLFGYSIAFFVKGFFEKRAEEKPEILSPFHSLLFVFSAIVISLFIFFITENTNETHNFYTFCVLILCIVSYLIIRSFFDYFIGKILHLSEITRYFLFSRIGYLYTLSLLLFPVLIIYVYGFKNSYFLIGSFAILFFIRLFLLFYNNKNLILNNLFYFILYLCALEIAPLFILYKVLTK